MSTTISNLQSQAEIIRLKGQIADAHLRYANTTLDRLELAEERRRQEALPAYDQLESLAKNRAAETNETFEQAFKAVADENPELYQQSVDEETIY